LLLSAQNLEQNWSKITEKPTSFSPSIMFKTLSKRVPSTKAVADVKMTSRMCNDKKVKDSQLSQQYEQRTTHSDATKNITPLQNKKRRQFLRIILVNIRNSITFNPSYWLTGNASNSSPKLMFTCH